MKHVQMTVEFVESDSDSNVVGVIINLVQLLRELPAVRTADWRFTNDVNSKWG